MPRALIHTTMSKDLAIFGEIELTLDESIGELARVDRERADVASDLLGVFFHPLAEDHFKNSRAALVRCAKY